MLSHTFGSVFIAKKLYSSALLTDAVGRIFKDSKPDPNKRLIALAFEFTLVVRKASILGGGFGERTTIIWDGALYTFFDGGGKPCQGVTPPSTQVNIVLGQRSGIAVLPVPVT